jgi:Ribosome biogenesis protein Nop16
MVCIRYRKSVKRALIKKQGRVGNLQARQPKKDFYNPKRIQDPEFRAVFDKEKTWIENGNSVDLQELYASRLPESIPDKARWTIEKLSEDHQQVITKLIAKHGEANHAAMGRDRKVNLYQWTTEQVSKKIFLLNQNRVHVCSEKCLCGTAPNSSQVSRKLR